MRVIVGMPPSQRLILLPSLDYLRRNRMIKNNFFNSLYDRNLKHWSRAAGAHDGKPI
jgi:hypothetical protein